MHFYEISIFRLVRQVCIALTKTNYRWSAGALGTIHEVAEHYLITLLENANLCAIHVKRVTVSVSDVQLVIKM